MKRKIISWQLIIAIAISCVICGNGSFAASEDQNIYKLGETVSTNIMECTLETAELTICLNNILNDPYVYFTPKEYDAAKDTDNPFVASIGHTLVYFKLAVTNLDRTSADFEGHQGISNLTTVIIDNTSYTNDIKIGAKSSDDIEWKKNETTNVLIPASETMYIKCYMDIPVDIEDLSNDFDIELSLPNSSGELENFKYHVTEDAITEQAEQEISLDTAIERFLKTEGQEYFLDHLDDFTVLSGEEIKPVLMSKTRWNVEEKNENGSSWTGKFAFESGGTIEETIYDGSVGHFNDRTWWIDGNNIVLSSSTSNGVKTESCEVRKVKDDVYLFVLDGAPYTLIQ